MSILLFLVTGAGFIFKLKNEISLLKNDLKNTNATVAELKQKMTADYTKIENKIAAMDEKIEQLPINITNLIKTFLIANNK